MKIIHQREKCIGCGSCAAFCPRYWEMAGDGKARLLDSEPEEGTNNDILEIEKIGCNQEAAEICPTQCIKIKK